MHDFAADIVLRLVLHGLDEVWTDVGPHLHEVLVAFDFGALNQERQRLGGRDPN